MTVTGDFRMSNGNVRKDIEHVRRCPEYTRYFGESELMKQYPEKCPVPTRGDHCPAAIKAHIAVVASAEAKEQAKRKRERFR